MQWISVVIISGLAALIPLLLTLGILLRKPQKDAIHWCFVSMVLSAIAWNVTFTISNAAAFLGHPAPLLGAVSGMMVLLNAVAFYIFCEYFPLGSPSSSSRYRMATVAVVSMGIFLFQLSPDYMTNRRIVNGVLLADRGASFVVAGAGITLIALGGLVLLAYKHSRITDVRSRTFIKAVFAAYVGILLLVFVFTYGLPLVGWERYTFVGPTAYVFLFICLGYLIVIHRFLDLRSAVLRMALWGLFTVLPGVAFVLFLNSPLVPDNTFARLFITAFIFLAMYQHVQHVQPRLNNLFFRHQLQMEESLVALMQDLQSIGEGGSTLTQLLEHVLDSLQNALHFEQGALVAIDRFRRVVVTGRGRLPEGFHQAARLLLHGGARLKEPFAEELNQLFLLEATGRLPFSHATPAETEYPHLTRRIRKAAEQMQAGGFVLLVPLIVRAELCGYVALGRKADGLPYYQRELSMLEAVRHSIAMALRNHVYFEELLLLRNQAQAQADELSTILSRRTRPATAELVTADAGTGRTLVFSSRIMSDVYAQVKEMASQRFPVLITGETGTGKELIARLIHSENGAEGPFVAMNCAAIPPDLWESEVFGHVRGAFTDAKTDKEGFVAQAAGGTLFLDEIGEMPLPIQPKILRLLQERRFRRVGDDHERDVACRLVFATNRDLQAMTRQNTFRKDLFYRVSVLSIRIPPLRERSDEIPTLIEFLLPRYAQELSRETPTIRPEALEALCRYFWPGNIRELENTLIQAILSARSGEVTLQQLPAQIRESGRVRLPETGTQWSPDLEAHGFGQVSFDEMVNEYMTHIIGRALRLTGNSGPKAAELLGMKPGKLYYQMSKLGIGRQT